MEGMSESLLTFLQHLREFGLVFQRKVSHQVKVPTSFILYQTILTIYRLVLGNV